MTSLLIFSEKIWPLGSGAQLALKLLIDYLLREDIDITLVTLTNNTNVGNLRKIYLQKAKNARGKLKLVFLPGVFRNYFDLLVNTIVHARKILELIRTHDILYIADTWIYAALLAANQDIGVVKTYHSLYGITYFTGFWKESKYNTETELMQALVKVNIQKGRLSRLLLEPYWAYSRSVLDYYILKYLIDVHTAPSRWACDVIQKRLSRECTYMPNIIPEEDYVPHENEEHSRFVFCYMGGKNYLKGYHVLLKAFLNIAKSYVKYPIKIILLCIGCTDLARKFTIKNFSIFLTRRLPWAYIKRVYRYIHIVIVPSIISEVCPYTIIEANLRGRPVIASNVGGIPELVKEGRNGWLFAPASTKELELRIINTLNLEKEEVINIGLQAREHILQLFNNERSIKSFLKIINFLS